MTLDPAEIAAALARIERRQDTIDRLRNAITTASHDDTSKPNTAPRRRHCERLEAVQEGLDLIDALVLALDVAENGGGS